MEPSPGSAQLNAIDPSPAAPDSPDGAPGTGPAGEDPDKVDADTSTAAPGPDEFTARTSNRYDTPPGNPDTR